MKKAINIKWDLDNDDFIDYGGVPTGLPEDVDIPDDIEDGMIEDYLSDVFGFCTLSFNIITNIKL